MLKFIYYLNFIDISINQSINLQNIFRNTKKVIPEFCDFLSPNFRWHKTDKSWFFITLETRFRQKGALFRKCFFSWISKYLHGQVLCVQFFDFRFRLDFSWGQYLMKKWQKRGPKKSLTNIKKLYTQYLTIKILVNSRKKYFRKSVPFWWNLASKIIINHDFSVLCHQKLGPKQIAKFWDDFFSVSKYILYHFHVSTQKKFLRVHTP